jgi:hypothetical protein
VGGGNTTLQFYENRLNQSGLGFPPGGLTDSAAEDCSAEIALASEEFETRTLSTPYTADLTHATFTPGTGGNPGSWTYFSPYLAYQGFFSLSGSYLSPGSSRVGAGPIAVAQGGSHEGALGQEGSGIIGDPVANTITAFKLNFPYVAGSPFFDWVTCNLGNIPNDIADSPFWQGADPHTVTAYQSPNTPFHSFAVFANKAPANYLAVVDLDMMLDKNTVPRDSSGYVCLNGTLPQSPAVAVVRFVQVRQ